MIAVALISTCIAALAFLVTREIVRTERSRAWKKPAWWSRPLPLAGVRQSISLVGDRSLVELVESRDPRRLEMGRINRKRRNVRA